jgi:hypothetical protein
VLHFRNRESIGNKISFFRSQFGTIFRNKKEFEEVKTEMRTEVLILPLDLEKSAEAFQKK